MTADDLFGRLDDDGYPAYTMGRAADLLGTTQGFLRAIGDARLITPLRSEGGHRRYSRYQLRLAARARELVDRGTSIEAACRIVTLEVRLEEAQRVNAEHGRSVPEGRPRTAGLRWWCPPFAVGTPAYAGGVTRAGFLW
ncbi:MerR family transcriptional regulator [Streptomyces sp. ISL-43]|nr:MerR family transcriptional regulator [Streptomyces sp. ISL-43]